MFGAAHIQGYAVGIAQPTRHATVVVMKMGADQGFEGQAFQLGRGGNFWPSFERFFVLQTCVDDDPAVAIAQQIDIDVIQRNRHGDACPEHTIGYALQRATRLGRLYGVDQGGAGAGAFFTGLAVVFLMVLHDYAFIFDSYSGSFNAHFVPVSP